MSDQETDNASGQQRRRIPVACARCRKRKIKCSGDLGDGKGCQNCRQAGCDPSECKFQRMLSIPMDFPYITNDQTQMLMASSPPTDHTGYFNHGVYPEHIGEHFNHPKHVTGRAYHPVSSMSMGRTSNVTPVEYMATPFDQANFNGGYPGISSNVVYGMHNRYPPVQHHISNGSAAEACTSYGIGSQRYSFAANINNNGARNLPVPNPVQPTVPFSNNMMQSLGSRQSVGWGPEARATTSERRDSLPYLPNTNNLRTISAINPRGSSASHPMHVPSTDNAYYMQSHDDPSVMMYPIQTTSAGNSPLNYVLPSMQPAPRLPTILPSAKVESSSATSLTSRKGSNVAQDTPSTEMSHEYSRQASSLGHYSFSAGCQTRESTCNLSGSRRYSGERSPKNTTKNSNYLVSGHQYDYFDDHASSPRQKFSGEPSPTGRSIDRDASRSEHGSPTNARKQSTPKTSGGRGAF